jgi:Spy/CpxP family protein refolding chaperone/peroxiredoxin
MILAMTVSLALAAEPSTTRPTDSLNPVGLVARLRERVESLRLTEAQSARLARIFAIAQEQARQLEMAVENLDAPRRLARIQPWIADLRRELGEVLTPRQLEMLRNQAATQPTREQAQRLELFPRLEAALEKLDLPESQKKSVNELLSQTQRGVEQILQRHLAGGPVQGEAQQLLMTFRKQLGAILTPRQRQRLQELLAEQAAPMAGEPAVSKPPIRATTPRPRLEQSTPTTQPTTAPTVGMVAPPFKLLTPGSAFIQLANLKGRVVVLEFGSVSTPTFRDHVAAMERLQDRYDNRGVYFLVIYTREAHPAGDAQVSRNEDDGITVDDPADLPARQARADKTRTALHMTLPIVVDTMKNEVTTAYDGFPNATIIIGRDGHIAARQQWNDPSGLPQLIDAALAASRR